MYDNIVLTHEDIVLLFVLVERQIKLCYNLISFKSSKREVERLKKEIYVLSSLLDKLKSIKQITYDKK